MTQAGRTNLAHQIASQPDELERLLTSGAVRQEVHAAAEALHRVRRIWMVGTGTSQHAAHLGAAMLQDAGRSAHAVSSMQFVKNAPIVGPKDGVVIVTHTGETSYALSARALAFAAAIQTVMISRVGIGMNDVIETVPKETSETYTVSYTTALLVLAMIAAEMGADSVTTEALRAVPDAVRGALAAPGTEQVPIPRRSLQIIGAGHASVTAKEGALKVREGARVLAEGHDAEFFLHGTAVPLTSDDHLLAIMSGDDDGLVEGVAAAAAGAGLGVTRLLETSGLPSVLAQIPLTVRLQLLASRFADERGQNPDTVIVPPWDDAGLWSIGSPIA
jgi:glucosamine--fructose-6-phosphate aminotransferase (isomerizing)